MDIFLSNWTFRKKDLVQERRGLSSAAMACGVCARRAGEDGVITLRACSNCGLAKYCSKDCQRKNWPVHKPWCQAQPARNISVALWRAPAVPEIEFCLMVCLSLVFDLDPDMPMEQWEELAAKPFRAHVLVGVEPSNVDDLSCLLRNPDNWNPKDIEGLLQIHGVWRIDDSEPQTQQQRLTWLQVRVDYPKHVPVALLEFSAMGASISCYSLPIYLGAIRDAKRMLRSSSVAPLRYIPESKEHTHRNYLNYLLKHTNEQIRADKKNALKLRTSMSENDKKLILDALLHLVETDATESLVDKVLREPIYSRLPAPYGEAAASMKMISTLMKAGKNIQDAGNPSPV